MSKPLSSAYPHAPARAPARAYPDDLTPAIQETLVILADLEHAHRAACERLEAWDGPASVKAQIAEDLAARHDAACTPYRRRLEALEERVREVATFSRTLVH